jgi:MFS family permease
MRQRLLEAALGFLPSWLRKGEQRGPDDGLVKGWRGDGEGMSGLDTKPESVPLEQLLTAGSIGDLYGRRLLFAIGIGIFTAGSALCGFATGTTFVALSRALQGVGGAVMFATSLALLADAFEPRERGTAFGVFGAVTGVAVAIGPVLGGAITSGLTSRARGRPADPTGPASSRSRSASARSCTA